MSFVSGDMLMMRRLVKLTCAAHGPIMTIGCRVVAQTTSSRRQPGYAPPERKAQLPASTRWKGADAPGCI